VPFDPANSDEHASFSRENIDPAHVSNINFRSRNEMMIIFQRWHAWAKTQKLIYRNIIAWNELDLRLTWGFTGNLGLWWERVPESDKLGIMNHDTPVDELVKVVVHEFYGSYKIDSDHYANIMSQKLCHISQLP
jgi:hypothetical protein